MRGNRLRIVGASVWNRDSHYLSQNAMDPRSTSAERISRHIRFNDADVPIHAVRFEERSFHFPGPCQIRISQTWIETSAWGDRSEMLVELSAWAVFLDRNNSCTKKPMAAETPEPSSVTTTDRSESE
jgi:hypothetical protein